MISNTRISIPYMHITLGYFWQPGTVLAYLQSLLRSRLSQHQREGDTTNGGTCLFHPTSRHWCHKGLYRRAHRWRRKGQRWCPEQDTRQIKSKKDHKHTSHLQIWGLLHRQHAWWTRGVWDPSFLEDFYLPDIGNLLLLGCTKIIYDRVIKIQCSQ